MAEIKVGINGDASGLVDEAKRAEAATERLAKEWVGLGGATTVASDGLTKAGKAAGKAADSTKPLAKSVKDTSAALKQLAPGSNQAGAALINLGRIAQDAPFGFIGIQNNINPLLESFQRLKAETGTTGGALKQLGSQLAGGAGLGLAVSVVTGLLTVFSGALFGSGAAADNAERKLKAYQDTIEGIKYSVDSFQSQTDFDLKFADINNQIRDFGKDSQNALLGLRQQLDASYGRLNNITEAINRALEERDKASTDPDLSEDKRAQARESAQKEYNDLLKQQRDALQNQAFTIKQIALQKLKNDQEAFEKEKAAAEKAAADRQAAINKTISQAKQLSAYLNERTFRNFDIDFNPLDSLQTQFDQAVKFIEKASNDRRSFALKINAVPSITLDVNNAKFQQELAVEGQKVAKALADAIAKLPKQKILIDFEADIKKGKDAGERVKDLIFGRDKFEGIPDVYKDALKSAEAINGVLAPAFNNLFDAIVKGEQPLKAFFQSIGQSIAQLIQKLIAAAIQAAILSAVLPGGGSGFGGFGGIFKGLIGARANGGPVLAGKPYLIGERGPELFLPSGSGRIVPNNSMNAGLQGISGGVTAPVEVYGRLSGKDILLSNARQGAYNNRNV